MLNNQHESATCCERPAKQALALAAEPRAKQEARSVPVAMFEQSENIAIEFEQLVAVRSVAYAIIGSKFMPLPSARVLC